MNLQAHTISDITTMDGERVKKGIQYVDSNSSSRYSILDNQKSLYHWLWPLEWNYVLTGIFKTLVRHITIALEHIVWPMGA